MKTATQVRTIALGDLVAAIFDQTEGLAPTVAGDMATRVVTDMLVRTDHTHLLSTLMASPRRTSQNDAHPRL
jgi:hypothetical protein